jgi:hypothetical protein
MRNISKATFLSFHVKLIYNAISYNKMRGTISKKQKLLKTDILKVSRIESKLISQEYLLSFFLFFGLVEFIIVCSQLFCTYG